MAINNSSPDGPSLPETRSECKDFDDGANALWTLYGEEAQIHDEARFQGLADDMNGVPTFVGRYDPPIIDPEFTCTSAGRLVCRCSHFIPRSKPSIFAA